MDILIRRQLEEPETIVKEKTERLLRVLELKTPDKVPLGGIAGDIIPYYGGITWYDLSYEYENGEKLLQAIIKFVTEIPQDFPFISAPYGIQGSILGVAFNEYPLFLRSVVPYMGPDLLRGPIHDICHDKWTRWPGRELGVDYHPQAVGGVYMQPEEYKYLIEDPVNFINNTVLPRACPDLGMPGTPQWNAKLLSLGLVYQKMIGFMQKLFSILAKKGQVGFPFAAAHTPADIIGDFLRNPTGAILDMTRYPDTFKSAVEALVEPILKYATSVPPSPPITLTLIAMHLNEMLPPKLYEDFYWEPLRKIILQLLNRGYKMFIIFEGDHTPHLDTILELPKGWGIGWFERANINRVWDKLAGHTTVMGGVPTSLISKGTPEKIEEYVKNLLNDVKPEGGFIIAPTVMDIPKETPPVNLRAFINAVEKYGRY